MSVIRGGGVLLEDSALLLGRTGRRKKKSEKCKEKRNMYGMVSVRATVLLWAWDCQLGGGLSLTSC